MCVFFIVFFYTNIFYNIVDYSTYYRNDDDDVTAGIGTRRLGLETCLEPYENVCVCFFVRGPRLGLRIQSI